MSVLMVGVDKSTKGGMWTVVENYLDNAEFVKNNDLVYIPTSVTECALLKKILFTGKAYLKIIRELKRNDFSIIHVHMSERASIRRKRIVMNYAKKKGLKIVLHLHGAEFEDLYKQMKERKKKFVRETLEIADVIIILGDYWKGFISELITDPRKIRVVYNAVDVPKEYKYNNNSNILLFLGAVSKRKGIDVLLQALDRKKDSFKNQVKVCVYGPDVDGNIEEKIRQIGLQDWVKYLGYLHKAEKNSVFNQVAVNILPSYNEGLPMTILETMAYGIPSISTDIAAIPEVVNEKNGILIKPGDIDGLANAIETMVQDSRLRCSLSQQSYKDIQDNFSLERHIQEIEKVYLELTGEK